MYYRFGFSVRFDVNASDHKEARQKAYKLIKEELDFRYRDVAKKKVK